VAHVTDKPASAGVKFWWVFGEGSRVLFPVSLADPSEKRDPSSVFPRASAGLFHSEPHGEEVNPTHSRIESHPSTFGGKWGPTSAALAILVMLLFLLFVFLFMMFTAQPAQAQTFKVIYTFGTLDRGYPIGLTMDHAGNLNGTTSNGDTVYQLTRKGSGWSYKLLHSFGRGTDGNLPTALAIGPDGSIYGTTSSGGGSGFGTVFNLRSPTPACQTALCPWTETLPYSFNGDDGASPNGDFVFDQSGNIYGTTTGGGDGQDCNPFNCGVIYELAPSNGGWTYSVLYTFPQGRVAPEPNGVVSDDAANLYGTTYYGGDLSCYAHGIGCGMAYQFKRTAYGWEESTLHYFEDGSDGGFPRGALMVDQLGNVYGTTSQGGVGSAGTVFELTPSNGGWTFSVLYSFTGTEGGLPFAGVTSDKSGNLYGTTTWGGAYQLGTVYKLTRSGDSWMYTSLHDFTGGDDGSWPAGNVVLDANGNLYGTATQGGAYYHGVVWEITP
jgi:uncharacterized repeat protein (TIGR03803 family)